jgi:hypothetical protein
MIEQCFWFIGNSIAENAKLRDVFLTETDLVDIMVAQVSK